MVLKGCSPNACIMPEMSFPKAGPEQMHRCLITGSRGFAGSHLCRLLRQRGWWVAGLGTGSAAHGTVDAYYQADLSDARAVQESIRGAGPDVVFHLAARTGRGGSWAMEEAAEANIAGTLNLFRALHREKRPVRVMVVGSSAQYGAVPRQELPITENTACRPVGMYGWSKVAAEAIGMSYHGEAGIETIAIRSFNHTGPGEPDAMVISGFARQMAEIEAGAEPVLRVGNLASVRDISDVRDIVCGYLALAERGRAGQVYNLCSGRGAKIAEVLDGLIGLSKAAVEVQPDPGRMQAADVPIQVGSFEKARVETGWSPQIPLDKTLQDLLEDWRRRIANRPEAYA